MKPLRGILETIIYCKDLPAAREFYERILGLTLVSYEPEQHLMFCVGRSMLLVFHPDDSRTKEVFVGGSMIPQHGSEGCSHFAFEVPEEEVASIKLHLAEHGIAIESEIHWPGGGHSIYCRDPEGNSVEFATASLWFDQT
jgi:catechol 2,3-dioxygenase-like lactoylglutathione lyase family enzyme